LDAAIKADKLTEHNDMSILDTLSVAYAANGKFAEAIEAVEKAIELALDVNNKALVIELKKHLALYRSSKPYTE